ncbi:TatD family hydrolase [Candidatus Roizmanbacteria bacterium]|nr:TatD family hydrolase [Candidatus Roizmanbacteria bacterium]
MIDAHCHLNFHSFENDFDEVIKRARDAGIDAIINTGTQISSSQWAIALAEKYERLFAVVGIHPHHADKVDPDWLAQLEQLARHPKVIGIGEIGMDYYQYQSNGIVEPEIQRKIFIEQLKLAGKLKLPLQVHTRNDKAREETIAILREHKKQLQIVPGMFHCMAGSLKSLKTALDLGFYVGFDGNSMYGGLPPNEPLKLRELIEYAPLDRIVIETDSPYLTPPPNRSKRNEPSNAIITAQFIAKLKHVPFEKLVEQTDKNVYTIFSKLKFS